MANRVGRDEVRALFEAVLGLRNPDNGPSTLVRCEICFERRPLDEMNPIWATDDDPEDPEGGFLGWECMEHDL